MNEFFALDARLLYLINQEWRNRFFDSAMPFLSNDVLFWTACTVIAFSYFWLRWQLGARRMLLLAVALGISVGVSDFAAGVSKGLIQRPRPHNTLPSVFHQRHGEWQQNPADFAGKDSRSNSFYSGHATNSMAFVATLTALVPQASPIVYIIPLTVGYSRVYLGKHYPSDVLFGWFAGWGIGKLVGLFFRSRFRDTRRKKL